MRLPSAIIEHDNKRAALRKLLSPLNLHVMGVAFMVLLCVYLGISLVITSHNAGAEGDEQIVAAQGRVAAAEIAARQLRGLDTKLQASDVGARRFYKERLPYGDSDVANQLGVLAKAANVRLSRASYVHAPASNDVTELRIDMSVTGAYPSVAKFINSLERDKSFFLVENLALSGAQGGLVNLQMRLGTYLREPMAN